MMDRKPKTHHHSRAASRSGADRARIRAPRWLLRATSAPNRLYRLAANHHFLQCNQADLPCPLSTPKNNPLLIVRKSAAYSRGLIPHEGRVMIVTNVGMRCGGRGSVGCARNRGAAFGRVSDQPAHGRTMLLRSRQRVAGCAHAGKASWRRLFAYGEAVWSWRPLLASSWRRCCEPNRDRTRKEFANDGDKTNSSPGRARSKP